MNLISITFVAVVLPLLVLLYYAINLRAWRNIVLLIGLILVYGLGNPVFILYMAISTMLAYLIGLLINRCAKRSQARQWLIVGAIINFGGLAAAYWVVPKVFLGSLSKQSIILPYLLLVFTLQTYSYINDVYRGVVSAEKNYFALLLCLSLFPQLAIGPIVRYSDIYMQLINRRESIAVLLSGFGGLLAGLFKVVFLAHYAGTTATKLLQDNLVTLSSSGAWIGLLFFSCQMYFLLSGLSDIAISLARMFGFEFRPNFRTPYAAVSVTDFWRRWNPSLSSYLSEYVTPNRFAMMALIGLWHGFRLNVLVWGIYFALLMTLEKRLFAADVHLEDMTYFNRIITLFAIMFGWGIFFYTNPTHWLTFVQALLGMSSGGVGLTTNEATIIHHVFWLVPIMVLWCTPLPGYIGHWVKAKLSWAAYAVQFACFLALLATGLWFFISPLAADFKTLQAEAQPYNSNAWLEGTYASQLEKYLQSLPAMKTVQVYINQLEVAIRYDWLVSTVTARQESLPHQDKEKPMPQEESSQHIEDYSPAPVSEIYVVAGDYLVFDNKAIELYIHDTAKVDRFKLGINQALAALPQSLSKYVLVAPMRICYEENEYKQHSDDLKTAINTVYTSLPPEIKSIPAYEYLAKHRGEKLFLNTDYYWSALGAYYGAQAFADVAGLQIRSIFEYELRQVHEYVGAFVHEEQAGGLRRFPEKVDYYVHREVTNTQVVYSYTDISSMVGYEAPAVALSRRGYDIFLGKRTPLRVIQGDANNARVLMIVGDEYQRAFAPWLIPCFERILVIDPLSFTGGRAGINKLLAEYKVTDFLLLQYGKELATLNHLAPIMRMCIP